ncbi:CALCINEURIN-LIKE METALLO-PHOSPHOESTERASE SUPERFAMILY PROTEIN [Salix koriyanagi]|uniref:CALCINEURIN-LIKE METALLO-PHOSPHOESTERASE SUPERFAMILY PROTEIN n=1 Tax=Salix koriyanagi TaxID=2511006 RepID=A0A9Q0W2F6_9ROSI|nr:CALCINEURIN-LIKE METALLO-PHOSPHOESTERASE SUPERFAMILY PROTEIN [Salix koriyanagi]
MIHSHRMQAGLFPPQKVPWYSTKVANDGKVGCFLEHFNITRGKMLTVVGLDTGIVSGRLPKNIHLANFSSRKVQDSMLMGSTSDFKNSQLNWLTQSLETAADNWIIVSGYHPVVICDKEQQEAKQINGPLQNIFMKHGVNAYMSRQGCSSHTVQGGVTHIGIADPTGSQPLVHLNGRLSIKKETINDGFLLHRVGSLEITTYFVSSAGEIVNEAVIKQHGKEDM